MKHMVIIWMIGAALLAVLTYKYQGETTLFHGVAEANEIGISVESPVEVLDMKVVPGQKVKPGDTLVRLSRPELSLRIRSLMSELQGVQGKTAVSASEMENRLAEIRSSYVRRRNEIQFEIDRLKNERSRNLEIASKLKSLPREIPDSNNKDGLLLKINALKNELSEIENSFENQKSLVRGSQGVHRSSGNAMRSALEQELALLHQEESKLVIIARNPGIVSAVNFREGENVSPFSDILNLSPLSPTFIRGYIHEKVYNRVAIGDSVAVISNGELRGAVHGVVVGVGSRIVEFPVRMRKIPESLVWGREVMIQIPAQNPFLLGELVTLDPMEDLP